MDMLLKQTASDQSDSASATADVVEFRALNPGPRPTSNAISNLAVTPAPQSADALPFRPPPRNIEAEQALLGAILLKNEAYDRVSGFLKAEHFYDPLHQQIYEIAGWLINSGKPATPVTLKTFFENAEPVDADTTVAQYLGKLVADATSTVNAPNYARTIRDLAARRQMILIGEDMVNAAFDSPVDFPPAEQIEETSARLEDLARSGGTETVPVVTAASFSTTAVPSRLWNVQGLVPSSTVTLLYGDGGTGKSLVATQLGISSATRRQWLGYEVTGGPVLYIGAEDDLEEMHRRVAAIAAHMDISLDRLADFHIMGLADRDAILAAADGSGVLRPTSLWRVVSHLVKRLQVVMVIYDTLADLFAGNENDRSQARQFVGMLRGLAIETKSAALLLAHPSLSGISSGSGSSGSTAWSNSVRSRLYLDRIREADGERDTDARVLRSKKANYAATGQELRIRWRDGVFVPEDNGGPAPATLAKHMQADRVFLELLAAYEADGRNVSASPGANYAPSTFAEDDRAKPVGKKALEAAMNRLFQARRIHMVDYGPASKRRKRISVTS